MSTEEPGVGAETEPPPPTQTAQAPAQQDAPPPQPAPPSPAGGNVFLFIVIAVIALAVGGYIVSSINWRGGQTASTTFSVQPYTPPSQLISAHDHVIAYAQPDPQSRSVVMFGPGVGLQVTGRVSRGLGNDWYAITWNAQTAYIRVSDAVAGEATAPPPTAPHQEQPDIIKKPEPEEDLNEDDFPTAPPVADSGPLQLRDVEWIRAPNARDFARYYPSRALDQGRSGRVVLDCVASGSGSLDCSVVEESPRGYDFGDAAISISRQTRIEPTLPDGRSVAGGHLRLPMQFRAG